ncbi:MAG: DHH family phosphoesterase, partial [Desulfobacterales bacterium]
MRKRWHVLKPDPDCVGELSRCLKCSPIVATLLVNRRVQSCEDAAKFLAPVLAHLRPPFGLKDMPIAVDRVTRAIVEQENILVFGDYDVDGVTAAAVLFDFLRNAGARVSYYIPHRLAEGYG